MLDALLVTLQVQNCNGLAMDVYFHTDVAALRGWGSDNLERPVQKISVRVTKKFGICCLSPFKYLKDLVLQVCR